MSGTCGWGVHVAAHGDANAYGVRQADLLGRGPVLMVSIVHMRGGVLQGLVDVFVLMLLGQVQPDTEAHQQAGNQELVR